MLKTDKFLGLDVAVSRGVFWQRACKLCVDDSGIVVQGEYGLTKALFDAGFGISTLMSKYAFLSFSTVTSLQCGIQKIIIETSLHSEDPPLHIIGTSFLVKPCITATWRRSISRLSKACRWSFFFAFKIHLTLDKYQKLAQENMKVCASIPKVKYIPFEIQSLRLFKSISKLG